MISGHRVHPPCWMRSTAAERAEQATAEAHATTAVQPPDQPLPTARPSPTPAASQRAGDDGAPAPAAAAAEAGFRAAAAVVDVDEIWLSNGEHVPMPGQGPSHVGDLVRLAQWLHLGTQTTKYLATAGQVWVTDRLAQQLGINVAAIEAAGEQDKDKVTREVTKDSVAVTAAIEAGFSIGGKDGDSLGRWTRVWKGTEKSVWVVLLPAMTRDAAAVALMGGNPDHATLARRIGLLADALAHPYQLSGSTTGLDLMTALRWKDREKFFAAGEPVPARPSRATSRPTSPGAAYPPRRSSSTTGSTPTTGPAPTSPGSAASNSASANRCTTPTGRHLTRGCPATGASRSLTAGDWRMPHPLDPRGRNVGKVRWLTTPGLEFAFEQGYEPQIMEAYTWPEHARILDPWYERIRDARTAAGRRRPRRPGRPRPTEADLRLDDRDARLADPHGRPAPGTPRAATHDHRKARTNILRRVAKIGQETGRWPVAIITDTVLYTSQRPTRRRPGLAGQAWIGPRALGRYKVEGSARLEITAGLPHRRALQGQGRHRRPCGPGSE